MKKVFFTTKDGLKLCGIWHLPVAPTKKAIILAHGLTVDKDEEGIFIELAELLKNNGYAVLRFDFRGSGESDGKSVDMTISGDLLDLKAAVDEAKTNGYQKLGLLGASFGGGIAVLYTANNPALLQCLCLWNPVLNYDHVFIHPTSPWLLGSKDRIKTDLQNKGWTEIGSSNFPVGKKLYDEMERIFPYEILKKILLPTLIVHGDKDYYVPIEDSIKYVTTLKNGKLITIKDGQHGFQATKDSRNKSTQETLKFFQKYL